MVIMGLKSERKLHPAKFHDSTAAVADGRLGLPSSSRVSTSTGRTSFSPTARARYYLWAYHISQHNVTATCPRASRVAIVSAPFGSRFLRALVTLLGLLASGIGDKVVASSPGCVPSTRSDTVTVPPQLAYKTDLPAFARLAATFGISALYAVTLPYNDQGKGRKAEEFVDQHHSQSLRRIGDRHVWGHVVGADEDGGDVRAVGGHRDAMILAETSSMM
ncbi:hypothetical protein D9611_006641 [Ephemerocybe angulata]|uniref:Uncharacterized protein n=1 Tax=Ephemerocybe angulata TaxID=980116 RepID=A0A8H5FHD4_9AGAR|nr:hypothetical protein D9611_006641 [Tulosesus angulatus]